MMTVIAHILTGLAGIGCLYTLAAASILTRYARRKSPAPRWPGAVTVLKPLHGDEPRLLKRLEAFCRQDYPAPVQVVLGVQSPDDPALDAAFALAAAFPDQVDISIDSRMGGANRKVSNLLSMMKLARHDILVMSDSDIEVGLDYLSRLAGELEAPGTGAVTCLYHGVAGAGFWSRLGGMGIDMAFLPNAVVGVALRLAKPCFGSTIAIRRETLTGIGGLEAFADHLADDYAIGKAVRARGLRVAVPAFTIGHVCDQARAANLWSQELRWARTIRTMDPTGYAGTVLTHPLPLALLGSALGSSRGLWIAGAALVCRCLLCLSVERSFTVPRHAYWMIPVRDLFSFAIFLWSFAGSSVRWRGEKHEVTRGGMLQPKETA